MVGVWPEKYTGEKSDFEAFTWTNLSANWKFKKTGSSVCQYEFTEVKGTASFYTDASWAKDDAKTGKNSAYLLNHEQGHMDITEIQARAFERDLLGKTFSCPSGVFDSGQINANTNQIFQEYVDGMGDLNRLYDDETKHSLNEKKQDDWDLKFDCMLENNGPTSFCLSLEAKQTPEVSPEQPAKAPTTTKELVIKQDESFKVPTTFETFTSDDFGFSINYPKEWTIDSEPIEDENWIGIASFTPNSQTWEPFFGVSVYVDKQGFQDLTGNQYLTKLIEEQQYLCDSVTIEEYGINCYDFEILESEIFVEGGFEAYALGYIYLSDDSDGNTTPLTVFIVEIPIEDVTWELVFDSTADDWDLYGNTVAEMIGSFELIEFEEAYKEPKKIEDTITTTEATPESSGGCLIATATYGSKLTPQVQFLREIRDNIVMPTQSGASFMTAFNAFYYSFSPTVADLERQNPVFKETIKVAITPLISSLSLLQYVDIDSEAEMLGYGIGIILLNIGMYFGTPAILFYSFRNRFKHKHLI